MHRTLLDRSCDEAKSTVSVRVTKQCSLRILKIKYQEFLIHTLESSNIGSIIIINIFLLVIALIFPRILLNILNGYILLLKVKKAYFNP